MNPPTPNNPAAHDQLVSLDHQHVWHPFTPMRQWREQDPIIIESAKGDLLTDTLGRSYIDGVSSLWCNVHGHQHPAINAAIVDQLNRAAHTTMLGLSSPPAIQLAAKLCDIAPKGDTSGGGVLNKVFYSDAGATANELALKMAIGYYHNTGRTTRNNFIAFSGAYHGDTTGAMSLGYSPTFHRAFQKLTFQTEFSDPADLSHSFNYQPSLAEDGLRVWAQDDEAHNAAVCDAALAALDQKLTDLTDTVAAVIIEPLVQGAAGLIMQPPGFVAGVAALCKKHDTLLIADEVAVGLGRTGEMFACDHENVTPDILCLGKGLSGGYLPLAATLCTDEIEQAFTGEIDQHKTLYHGHTFTGNPLACAAALASLELFESTNLINEVQRKANLVAEKLKPLRDPTRFPQVIDIRQRGLMIGIELSTDGQSAKGFDPSKTLGKTVCQNALADGLIIRPLGNTLVLMPPLAIEDANLTKMIDVTMKHIEAL